MLSKRTTTKGLGVLGLGAGLVMIAVSFTVYALNGREMNEVLAWMFWLGLGLAGTGLVFFGTASIWPEDAVQAEPSGNTARRNRRNRSRGKR